jgi:hypothetical protein
MFSIRPNKKKIKAFADKKIIVKYQIIQRLGTKNNALTTQKRMLFQIMIVKLDPSGQI